MICLESPTFQYDKHVVCHTGIKWISCSFHLKNEILSYLQSCSFCRSRTLYFIIGYLVTFNWMVPTSSECIILFCLDIFMHSPDFLMLVLDLLMDSLELYVGSGPFHAQLRPFSMSRPFLHSPDHLSFIVYHFTCKAIYSKLVKSLLISEGDLFVSRQAISHVKFSTVSIQSDTDKYVLYKALYHQMPFCLKVLLYTHTRHS